MNKRILHITRAHSKGPGVYTYTIHQELLKQGYNSQVLTLYEPNNEDETVYSVVKKKFVLLNKIKTLFKIVISKIESIDINWDYYPYSLNEQKIKFNIATIFKKNNLKPDIIILYFTDSFLNAKSIHSIYKKTRAKIYWFLPDMGPLTGACHYAWDCDGYRNACGNCPAINSKDKYDKTHKNILYKLKYYKNIPIEFIAASSQLYNQIKRSAIFRNNKTHKILIPIDSERYKPIARKILRRKSEGKTIFIGAQGLNQKRKGLKILLDALKIAKLKYSLSSDDLFLIIAGNNIDKLSNQIVFNYKYVGYLDSNKELPEMLASADFYISPSIEDSGPMMLNQSIMAGTPVLAFNIGVAQDIIISGETGFIADKTNSEALAKQIYNITKLETKEIERMSQNCRALAISKFSTEVIAKELIKYF